MVLKMGQRFTSGGYSQPSSTSPRVTIVNEASRLMSYGMPSNGTCLACHVEVSIRLLPAANCLPSWLNRG